MGKGTSFGMVVEDAALRGAFARFGTDGTAAARALVQEVANSTRRRARENLVANGTNATGELATSIRLPPTGDSRHQVSREVHVEAAHALFVELGTKAKGAASSLSTVAQDARNRMGYRYGITPGGPIPPGSLDAWMRARGIPADADYPIRAAIGRTGIRAQPYFFPAVEVAMGEFPRKARERMATLERSWRATRR